MVGCFRLMVGFAGALLLAAWLLPNHYFPWVSFYSDFAAFSFLSLLALGCVLTSRSLPVSGAAIGCFVIALIPLGQWLAGKIVFAGDAAMASIYLCGAAFAVVIGGAFYSAVGDKGFQYLAGIIAVGALIAVWMALGQWLQMGRGVWVMDMRAGARPYANLGQPNNLATLLSMGLMSILYLWERRSVGVLLASLVAVLLLVGVVLTQSRTPWLGALCFLVWRVWKGGSHGARLSLISALRWVAVYSAMVVVFPYVADWLHLSAPDFEERTKEAYRFKLWQQFLYAVVHGGWWGFGWNQVVHAQLAVTPVYPVSLMVEHSHNIGIDLLLWNGPLVGSLIICAVIVWLGRMAWKASGIESLYGLAVGGLLFLHGMLELPLEYAYFLLPVGVLLGMVERQQGGLVVVALPRWGGMSIVIIGALLMGWVWREYRVIEEDHRLMRFETAGIGLLRADQPAPDVIMLDQLREFLRFARTHARAGMSDLELESMQRIVHRYPYPPSLFRYALALGLNHHPEDSVRQMLLLKGLYAEDQYREAVEAMRSMTEKHPQLHQVVASLPAY